MQNETLVDPTADLASALELGIALGQTNAFGLVAGRCSAAQAEGIRRLREQKLYKGSIERWDDFCPKYLKMSRAEADRIIRLLEEFGPAYFELSQLTRVSPESYRAIAPHIENGVLHYNGETIELNAENSQRVAAAVTEMRHAIPKKTSALDDVTQELNGLIHESDVQQKIQKLARCCFAIAAEFEKIARDQRLGDTRFSFRNTLALVRDEMARLAEQA
ncbi:MAG TPA: hypothetical protein VMB03_22745 [Bryobacteraceae bacterium]|nr:hypothetical protein [Bryobacteraceae bacterium]